MVSSKGLGLAAERVDGWDGVVLLVGEVGVVAFGVGVKLCCEQQKRNQVCRSHAVESQGILTRLKLVSHKIPFSL